MKLLWLDVEDLAKEGPRVDPNDRGSASAWRSVEEIIFPLPLCCFLLLCLFHLTPYSHQDATQRGRSSFISSTPSAMAKFKPLRKFSRNAFYCQKSSLPLEATPAPIQRLPIDLLRYIVDRIPPADAAALALSSKAILSTVGFGVLRIEGIEDRVKLLKHLEVFYPKHLLCYQCGKLHHRRKKIHRYIEDTECDRKNGRFSFNSLVLNLPFTRVQEIMNRHRYGKRHGISVKTLNRLRPWIIGPLDFMLEKTRAKIVDGQLFIRMDFRFFSECQ